MYISVCACSVAQSCLTLCDPRTATCRLLCPWDWPSKSTEVGSHFLLQGIFPTQWSNSHLLHWQADSLPLSHLGKEERKWSCSVMSHSLQHCGLQTTRLLCPWDSPGKNTGVGCHFLLEGIFPTRGSYPGLPLQPDSLLSEPPGPVQRPGKPGIYLYIHVYIVLAHETLMKFIGKMAFLWYCWHQRSKYKLFSALC